MSDDTVSREEFEALSQRVKDLEAQLEDQSVHAEAEGDAWDPGDPGRKVFDESSKIMQGFMEATMDAFNEATHAMSNMGGGMDRDRMGAIPNGLFDVMQKGIELQKSALDRMRNTTER